MNETFRRKVLPCAGIGLLVILLTIAGYFLTGRPDQWVNLDYFSLGFVLLSEVLLFFVGLPATLLKTSRGKVLARSGANGILFLYWLVTCLLGFLARPLFTVERTRLFVLCNLAALIVALVALVVFFVVSGRLERLEHPAEPSHWVQECLGLIASMQAQNSQPTLQEPLHQLEEAARYADPTATCPQDARIHGELVILQQNLLLPAQEVDLVGIQERIVTLLGLFKERAAASSQQKRGKY